MKRRLVLAGLAAGALAACAGDPPPPETFYRLGTPAPVQALAGGPIKGIVDVSQVRTQGVVGGRAILYRSAPDQVIAYHYHAWQEPTGVMMQRALLDALRAAQAFETVATPEMRLERNFELQGDLLTLEHVLAGAGGRVVVEIEITLRRIAGNQPLLMKTYRAEEPAGATVASTIPAFTRAVDKITAGLLADLAALPK
ncbi:MAG: membrane integrity-associated transporter subunit PqiC [Rhodospirillaceae bacterium]|nr:membrane integrity-associated transporter subunit PqiC [Rhodospirillaceae bacterium]